MTGRERERETDLSTQEIATAEEEEVAVVLSVSDK